MQETHVRMRQGMRVPKGLSTAEDGEWGEEDGQMRMPRLRIKTLHQRSSQRL